MASWMVRRSIPWVLAGSTAALLACTAMPRDADPAEPSGPPRRLGGTLLPLPDLRGAGDASASTGSVEDADAVRVDAGPGPEVGPEAASGPTCAVSNGGCDPHATCTMTGSGPIACFCDQGYAGDGRTCAPVDACLAYNGGCDANATCTSTGPGTSACACNAGYAGNGITCSAVDACATNNGGCDPHATCTSTGPGATSCVCDVGYGGDGTSCALPYAAVALSPSPGEDMSMGGGYPMTLAFDGMVAFTGTGSATLYDLTAGTSTSIPPATMSTSWYGPTIAVVGVDNGPAHSPAHAYALEVSPDLITGFSGISDTGTWYWFR